MHWADAFANSSPHELWGIPKAMQANLEGAYDTHLTAAQ